MPAGCDAVYDDVSGRWISRAEVAEIGFTAFSAQKKADGNPVEVPTTVKNDGALKGAQEAADAAQKVANRDNNHIEYHTRIDTGGGPTVIRREASSPRASIAATKPRRRSAPRVSNELSPPMKAIRR